MFKKALLIGYVWPEPRSSAAGLRTFNLIEALKAGGIEVHFASASKNFEARHELEVAHSVETHKIELNDSSFDEWLLDLNPEIVIFDRYVIEEQFGWRVRQTLPQCIRIIDTQDLHFLRRAREKALKQGASLTAIASANIPLMDESSCRELASLYRSDLSLIISDFEMQLLETHFQIPKEKLFLWRFSYPPRKLSSQILPSFEDRNHFCFIGNFRHAPNHDGTFWFLEKIWPGILSQLPQAQAHFYGAYPSKEIMKLNSPEKSFRVFGPAPEAIAMLAQYRINLAPLRYGAGIKGKISDSWAAGTPSLSTPIGAEGMHGALPFGGQIAESEKEFIQSAVELYQNKEQWQRAQKQGFDTLESLYNAKKNNDALLKRVEALKIDYLAIREADIFSQILWHQQFRSTEFFSRWIEEKNKST
jgi:O-antigen biosynthesis protein